MNHSHYLFIMGDKNMKRHTVITAFFVFLALLVGPAQLAVAEDQPKVSTGEQALFKAFDEIDAMTKRVEAAATNHEETLKKLLFIKFYYTKRAGIPDDALGKSVYIIGENGRPNDYPEWLSQTIPGADRGDAGIQQDKVISKLKTSLHFLKTNSEYYTKHPLLSEMNYLREGMDKWRSSWPNITMLWTTTMRR